MNYFAKNLKYLRESKKIEQQRIADDLNIPRSTYSCWEAGIRTPKVEQIQQVADYFNVNIDIISRDYSLQEETNTLSQQELLFNKVKDSLTESDWNIINAIVEQRKKEIDNELENK